MNERPGSISDRYIVNWATQYIFFWSLFNDETQRCFNATVVSKLNYVDKYAKWKDTQEIIAPKKSWTLVDVWSVSLEFIGIWICSPVLQCDCICQRVEEEGHKEKIIESRKIRLSRLWFWRFAIVPFCLRQWHYCAGSLSTPVRENDIIMERRFVSERLWI